MLKKIKSKIRKWLTEPKKEISEDDQRVHETAVIDLTARIKNLEKALSQKNGADLSQTSFVEMVQQTEAEFTEKHRKFKGTPDYEVAENLAVATYGIDNVKKESWLVEHAFGLLGANFGMFGPFALSGFDIEDHYIESAQRQCMMRYFLDPVAFSVIENLCSYVIGRGLKIKTPSKILNEFIKERYWKYNEMEGFHKHRFKMILILGEWFNRYKRRDNGYINIHHIPFDEIDDIEMRENLYPISFKRSFMREEDLNKNEEVYPSFRIGKYTDEMGLKESEYFDRQGNKKLDVKAGITVMDDEPVYHMKIGYKKRGIPILMRVLKNLAYWADFVKDSARIWHERQRVVWIEMQSSDRGGPKGQFHPSPAGGLVLVGVKGELEYEFQSPNVEGNDADVIGRILRLSINAGTRTPETISFYDASETVYASIVSTKNPYTNTVIDYQDMLQGFTLDEIEYIIQEAVTSRVLPQKMKIPVVDTDRAIEAQQLYEDTVLAIRYGELVNVSEIEDQMRNLLKTKEEVEVDTVKVPIDIIMPQVIEEDPKAQAEGLKIHKELGASKSTILTRLGYDPARELANDLNDELRRARDLERERTKITQGKDVGNDE